MANYPELTYRYPTENNDPPTEARPIITLDWSADMVSTQFSSDVERYKNIILMEDETSTIIPTEYVGYTTASKRLQIQPAQDLSSETYYRIIVKNKLLASDGRKSFNEYSWKFITAESTITAIVLTGPDNNTKFSSFPSFSWEAQSATGLYYRFELDERGDFGSPTATASVSGTTHTTAITPTNGSSYFWRVRAYSPTASTLIGPWSEIRSFVYRVVEASDISSTQVLPDTSTFRTTKSMVNGISNSSTFPTISFTFNKTPVSSYSDYITVTRKAVLPRNDDVSTYDTYDVAGSWALSGNVLTFTPSEAIRNNTRYEVEISSELESTDGYVFGLTQKYYFTSRYAPYYADIRLIRSRFLSAESSIPDDLINYYIHVASLEANARYWGYTEMNATYGDSLLEPRVRDSGSLRSHGVLRWVEANAVYKMLKGILNENLRDIGRTEHLGDSSVSLSADFIKGIDRALDEAKQDLDQWDNYLIPSDIPLTVSKNSGWSPSAWDFDFSVRDVEAKRDDDNGWNHNGRWRYR